MTYAYTYNGSSDPIETISMIGCCGEVNEICKVDERLRAVLQITSA